MSYIKTKTTMDDIARQLNISKNSVSIALNNKKGVSDELRRQIVETARQMNYGSFSAAAEAKSRCIVAIVPEYISQDTFFYSDVFWSIEKEAQNEGCISIMASISQSAEKDLLLPQLPLEMDIVGFLVIGVISGEYLDTLAGVGLPVVTVDISYHNTNHTSITSFNLSGGFAAANYLIQNGHRKIGFIGPVYTAQSVYERWCGYNQALEVHDIVSDPALHITGCKHEFKLFDTIETLEPLVNALASCPTAWFCAGDRIAIALMNVLARKGIRVPDEVSVIGFDDISMSQLIFPALTTMHVDRELMGKLAVNYLTRSDELHGKIHVSLAVTLVERDSVRLIAR